MKKLRAKRFIPLMLAAVVLAVAGGAAQPAASFDMASALNIRWDGEDEDLWEWLGGDPETGEYIGEVDPWGIPGRIGPCPAYNQPVCGDDGSGDTVDGGETVILTWAGVTYRVHIFRHTSSAGGGDGNPNHSYEPGPGPGDHETDYTQCPGADDPAYDPNNEACWRAAP